MGEETVRFPPLTVHPYIYSGRRSRKRRVDSKRPSWLVGRLLWLRLRGRLRSRSGQRKFSVLPAPAPFRPTPTWTNLRDNADPTQVSTGVLSGFDDEGLLGGGVSRRGTDSWAWMVFPLVTARQLSSGQLFGNRADGWSGASPVRCEQREAS